MYYYTIIPASNTYDSLRTLIKNPLELFHDIVGQKLTENWSPIPVSLEKTKQRGDFPSMMSLVTFSEKAWGVLKPLIECSIEALPLDCKEGNYYLINIHERASIDLEKAEVRRLPDDSIISIYKYEFKKETVLGKHIFLLEEQPYLEPIVSETFKEIVEKNRLKGLIFSKVCEINENE